MTNTHMRQNMRQDLIKRGLAIANSPRTKTPPTLCLSSKVIGYSMVFILLSFCVSAQAILVGHQGRLLNNTNGTAMKGTFDINVTYYKLSDNSAVYTENITMTIGTSGVFDYLVGMRYEINPIIFKDRLYAKTKIDETQMSGVNITFVPYSIYTLLANNTDYFNGQSASYYATVSQINSLGNNVTALQTTVANIANNQTNITSWVNNISVRINALNGSVGSGTTTDTWSSNDTKIIAQIVSINASIANLASNQTNTSYRIYLLNQSILALAGSSGASAADVSYLNSTLNSAITNLQSNISNLYPRANIGNYTLLNQTNYGNISIYNDNTKFPTNFIIGQPLTGEMGSGLIWARNYTTKGSLYTNYTGLDVSYPNFTMRLVKTDMTVKYCNIPAGTVTVPNDAHTVYYVDNNCAVQNTPILTYIATDISPGGIADFFNVMAHSGTIEVIKGVSLQQKVEVKLRLLTFLTDHLNVISGANFVHSTTSDNITMTNAKYQYIREVVDSSQQNTSTGDTIEWVYHTAVDTWGFHDGTNLNRTICDTGSGTATCTNTNTYRRHFIFMTGWNVSGTDNTELHQLLPLQDTYYTSVANCMDTITYPLTYTLPVEYREIAVLLYAYCGRANTVGITDSQIIDLRTVKTGTATTGIDTTQFATVSQLDSLTTNIQTNITNAVANLQSNITSSNTTLWSRIVAQGYLTSVTDIWSSNDTSILAQITSLNTSVSNLASNQSNTSYRIFLLNQSIATLAGSTGASANDILYLNNTLSTTSTNLNSNISSSNSSLRTRDFADIQWVNSTLNSAVNNLQTNISAGSGTLYQNVTKISDQLSINFTNINGSVYNIAKDTNTTFVSVSGGLATNISNAISNLQANITSSNSTLWSRVAAQNYVTGATADAITTNLNNNITSANSSMKAWVQAQGYLAGGDTWTNSLATNISNAIANLQSNITSSNTTLWSRVVAQGYLTSITNTWSDTLQQNISSNNVSITERVNPLYANTTSWNNKPNTVFNQALNTTSNVSFGNVTTKNIQQTGTTIFSATVGDKMQWYGDPTYSIGIESPSTVYYNSAGAHNFKVGGVPIAKLNSEGFNMTGNKIQSVQRVSFSNETDKKPMTYIYTNDTSIIIQGTASMLVIS